MANAPRENPDQMEIERSFLLPFIPEFFMSQSKDEIDQGYLPSFRIRKKGEEFFLTKKIGPKGNCKEIEFPITKEEFDKNWEIGQEISLFKTRRYLEIEGKTYEADKFKFELEPLCSVEVEFKSQEEADAFIPPKWFGPEITKDERFSNFNLAKNGIDDEMMEIIKRVNEIMNHIEPIELNLNDGVNWIVRGAENLVNNGNLDRPVFINIAGGSNSGKTSRVTEEVKRQLEEKGISVEIISMDNFYHGPSFMAKMKELGFEYNYDQPEAYNIELFMQKLFELYSGNDAFIPEYDFKSDPTPDKKKINKSQVIIIEGLYALCDEIIAKYGDLKTFVDVSSHGRVIRRLLRDAGETGRSGQSPEGVLNQTLGTVEPMDKIHVQKQKKNAHIVVSNDHNPSVESITLKNKLYQTKIRLDNLSNDKVLYALQSMGFEATGELREVDFYYIHDNKDLISTGEIFRIRHETNNKKMNLTYKFPQEKEAHRDEPTYSFDINEQIEELIDKEYTEIGCILKNRLRFVKGDIEILIDLDVVGQLAPEKNVIKNLELGNFVEIRGGKTEDLDYWVDMILSLLSQNQEDLITKSYINIFLDKAVEYSKYPSKIT